MALLVNNRGHAMNEVRDGSATSCQHRGGSSSSATMNAFVEVEPLPAVQQAILRQLSSLWCVLSCGRNSAREGDTTVHGTHDARNTSVSAAASSRRQCYALVVGGWVSCSANHPPTQPASVRRPDHSPTDRHTFVFVLRRGRVGPQKRRADRGVPSRPQVVKHCQCFFLARRPPRRPGSWGPAGCPLAAEPCAPVVGRGEAARVPACGSGPTPPGATRTRLEPSSSTLSSSIDTVLECHYPISCPGTRPESPQCTLKNGVVQPTPPRNGI